MVKYRGSVLFEGETVRYNLRPTKKSIKMLRLSIILLMLKNSR